MQIKIIKKCNQKAYQKYVFSTKINKYLVIKYDNYCTLQK